MNTTIDLAPLQAHLNAIRTRTEAWVAEDPQNRWACYPVDDAEFWANQGITTVEAFEHDSLVGQISDQYKGVNGFRPSHMNLRDMTLAELRALSEQLQTEYLANRKAQQEHRWHCKALKAQRRAAALAAKTPVTPPPVHTGFAIGELVVL
jgi:hypothetical protein